MKIKFKWNFMHSARLSNTIGDGRNPLKENIFDQAFGWYLVHFCNTETPRNMLIINSFDFFDKPGIIDAAVSIYENGGGDLTDLANLPTPSFPRISATLFWKFKKKLKKWKKKKEK